jgi:DNA-binding NarL/FixJ family response regulator
MLELDPQICVVGEAADDCELVKMANRVRPDVVLIDIDRRCCDSFDAVAEIMQGRLTSSVVALTIHDDAEERAEAQRAGVYLFLEKGVPYKQLISAVRLAAANSSKTK